MWHLARSWKQAVVMTFIVAGTCASVARGQMPAAPPVLTSVPASSPAPGLSATRNSLNEREWTTLLGAYSGTKGVSRPSQDAVLGFSLPTNVSATTVKELVKRGGMDVKKGEVIVKGDDAEDRILLKLQEERVAKPLAVDRAKAAMELSDVEYNRTREAYARGASGTQEVDRARLQAQVAGIDWELALSNDLQEKIQLERLAERVTRYDIVAPFDGSIDLVNADLGQVVGGNEKVVRVVDVDPLWVDVPAPTDDQRTWEMTVGSKAWALASVAGVPRIIEGKVIEVSPTADPASRTRRIRVEVPNPPAPAGTTRLLAGEALWVRFTQPEAAQMPGITAASGGAAAPGGLNNVKQLAEGVAK